MPVTAYKRVIVEQELERDDAFEVIVKLKNPKSLWCRQRRVFDVDGFTEQLENTIAKWISEQHGKDVYVTVDSLDGISIMFKNRLKRNRVSMTEAKVLGEAVRDNLLPLWRNATNAFIQGIVSVLNTSIKA